MHDLFSNPAAIVVHGGAGGSPDDENGCHDAAQRGMAALRHGADALTAVTDAVVALEDDGRFNAGCGSVLCLDGVTVEMDAAVMDSLGRLGAVACVQAVKNPILVALAVSATPHWLLCGEGAERFARTRGFPHHYAVSEKSRLQHRQLLAQLHADAPLPYGADDQALLRFWNPDTPIAPALATPCDTVGAVARDAQGHFAVAGSTGGSAPSLLGRVGDTPIVGSGFYAGPFGAVAVTGIGEQIVRHLLAYAVYQSIADGMPLDRALQQGIDRFDPKIDIGLIAVNRTQAGSRSNRSMPAAILESGLSLH